MGEKNMKKQRLILEYAKLAALKLMQGHNTVEKRMTEIEDELKLTKEAIMQKAAQMAIATLK
jgi:hypothetical protein